MCHQSKCRPICHVIVLWAIKSELFTCHPLSAVLTAPLVPCKPPTTRTGKQIRVVKKTQNRGKPGKKPPIAAQLQVAHWCGRLLYLVQIRPYRIHMAMGRTSGRRYVRALDQIVNSIDSVWSGGGNLMYWMYCI